MFISWIRRNYKLTSKLHYVLCLHEILKKFQNMVERVGFSNWSQLFGLWSLLLPNPTNYSQSGPKHAFTQATPLANPSPFSTTQFTYHFLCEPFFDSWDTPLPGITGLGIVHFSIKALATLSYKYLKYFFASHVFISLCSLALAKWVT